MWHRHALTCVYLFSNWKHVLCVAFSSGTRGLFVLLIYRNKLSRSKNFALTFSYYSCKNFSLSQFVRGNERSFPAEFHEAEKTVFARMCFVNTSGTRVRSWMPCESRRGNIHIKIRGTEIIVLSSYYERLVSCDENRRSHISEKKGLRANQWCMLNRWLLNNRAARTNRV